MKRRHHPLRKQKTNQRSWFGVIILSFILIFIVVLLYKINSSVTTNSQAVGCFCGNLKCFNRKNFDKSYQVVNDQPQCCFGWPIGTLKNVKKNTCDQVSASSPISDNADTGLGKGDETTNIPSVTTIPIQVNDNNRTNNAGCQLFNCNNIGLGLRSIKIIKKIFVNGKALYYPNTIGNNCSGPPLKNVIDYCSYTCKIGTIGYGSCSGTSVWQKIDENVNQKIDDKSIIVGTYTDSNCTEAFNCKIFATPTLFPTIAVTGKKIILTNSSQFNLLISWGWIIKYADSNRNVALNNFYDNPLTNSMFSAIGTFSPNSNRTIDLTNADICKPDQQNPNASYWVDLQYKRSDLSGFMSIFNFSPAKSISIRIPCEQSGFVVNSSLAY